MSAQLVSVSEECWCRDSGVSAPEPGAGSGGSGGSREEEEGPPGELVGTRPKLRRRGEDQRRRRRWGVSWEGPRQTRTKHYNFPAVVC